MNWYITFSWKLKKRTGKNVTNFHDYDNQKDFDYICLQVILVEYILEKNGKYQPHVFLKECKYIYKKVNKIHGIWDTTFFWWSYLDIESCISYSKNSFSRIKRQLWSKRQLTMP